MLSKGSSRSNCCRTTKSELADQGRVLFEVAVANPGRAHNEVDNSRPTQSRGTVREEFKICLLVYLQVRWFKFFGFAFVLDGLLACPPAADNERTGRPRDEVRIFTGTLNSIEDNLKLWRDRYSYQSRLWCTGLTDCPEDAQSGFRNESVNVSFIPRDYEEFNAATLDR